MPVSIANALKAGAVVHPELYESASICFVDIVGFTNFCTQSSPMQIVHTLNELFTTFDALLAAADVYKVGVKIIEKCENVFSCAFQVETIGDAYMCVSGIPRRNGFNHVY